MDKDKILDAAQKFVLKGQSKKAIQEYLKLIEAAPKDKRLYLKLGDLYLKNGESDKAIKEYLKLAELYVDEDLNFRAISIYKRILSIDPKFREAFHRIAKLYLKEGLAGSAKSYYQSVLEITGHDSEALKALREMERQPSPSGPSGPKPPTEPIEVPKHQQRPPQVETPKESPPTPFSPASPDSPVFTHSPRISMPPESEGSSSDKDSEMHYHLGIAYKEMELYDYAVSEFEKAASDESMKFDCYIMLAGCLMEKGDYDKSIQYYTMASKLGGLPNEKMARLHFNLGLALEAKGMISQALRTFAIALRLDHSLSEAEEKIRKLQPAAK